MITTTIALIITNQRVPEVPPLPDIVLDYMEYLEVGLKISERIMITAIVMALLVILAHTHRMIILRRVFFLMGLMYYYRAITMQLTVLPKPDTNWACPKYNGSLDAEGTICLVKCHAGVSDLILQRCLIKCWRSQQEGACLWGMSSHSAGTTSSPGTP